jgi:hypothetical protein
VLIEIVGREEDNSGTHRNHMIMHHHDKEAELREMYIIIMIQTPGKCLHLVSHRRNQVKTNPKPTITMTCMATQAPDTMLKAVKTEPNSED